MSNSFDRINHELFMREAIKEADEAGIRGDRPIGAVIMHNGIIISRSSSRRNTMESHVAHAENTAIFQCAPYLAKHGRECILYTTVEPCIMCLSTALMANIQSIVFAVEDRYMNMKSFIESHPYIQRKLLNYVGGVLLDESLSLLEKYTPYDAKIITTGLR